MLHEKSISQIEGFSRRNILGWDLYFAYQLMPQAVAQLSERTSCRLPLNLNFQSPVKLQN